MRAFLAFLDESGFSERPPIRRTWAPRGQTPVVVEPFNWKSLSAIATLVTTSSGKKVRLFLRLLPGGVKSPQVKMFIGALRKHLRRPVILLWDRLAAHRSKMTQRYLKQQRAWLKTEWLPPYAPELNPVEYLWNHISGTNLANFRAKNLAAVAQQIRKTACKIRHHQNLGRAFLKHSGLF